MSREKNNAQPPSDELIMTYKSVPVDVASKYIGTSTNTIMNALKQERAPFGFATQNSTTGTWTYNISPGLLVAYKNGDLPTYRIEEVIKFAAEGIECIINARLSEIHAALGRVV